MRHLIVFSLGVLFALGLGLGGMTRPEKVIGFLDVTGAWDPSLAFVMGGALLANAVALRLTLRHRKAPVYGSVFGIPTRADLSLRLIGGSALFGVGWGLAGYCPGPGLTALASLGPAPFVFVGAMVAGMYGFTLLESIGAGPSSRARHSKSSTAASSPQSHGA